MLEIQKFLRNVGTPEDLLTKYAIKHSRNKEFPNLVLFKYDQIDSPMSESICQEARGIILDETEHWNVVCWSFKKFFNLFEGNAAKIDLKTAKCLEKLDGSLIQMYWYGDKWNVATLGVADASGPVSNLLGDISFAELFWNTWKDLKYPIPHEKHICFAFELMTPFNRIICKYSNSRIALIGARDLISMEEQDPNHFVSKYGYEAPISYSMFSLEGVVEMAKKLDPLQNEGFVVIDGNYNRVKIKNPVYVSLAHLKEGMSQKRLVEIIRTNESEEFLSYFPEFKEEYKEIKEKYLSLVEMLEKEYSSYKDIHGQKEFALSVKDLPYSGVLFSLRGKKYNTVKEALAKMNIQKLMQLLGMKE